MRLSFNNKNCDDIQLLNRHYCCFDIHNFHSEQSKECWNPYCNLFSLNRLADNSWDNQHRNLFRTSSHFYFKLHWLFFSRCLKLHHWEYSDHLYFQCQAKEQSSIWFSPCNYSTYRCNHIWYEHCLNPMWRHIVRILRKQSLLLYNQLCKLNLPVQWLHFYNNKWPTFSELPNQWTLEPPIPLN